MMSESGSESSSADEQKNESELDAAVDSTYSSESRRQSTDEQGTDKSDGQDIEEEQPLGAVLLRTPQKRKKSNCIPNENFSSSDEGSQSSNLNSSSADSLNEYSHVLVKTPKKKKRSERAEPIHDLPVHDDDDYNEPYAGYETDREESESDHSVVDLSESFLSASEGTSSNETSSFEEEQSEHGETESEEDNSHEDSSDIPLYDGCKLTSGNFDALLLALFQKHHVSEAAKEDFLKLLEVTLPDDNNSATSSYTFNKRHSECRLMHELMEVCPTCHQKVEKDDVCRNSECNCEGEKVEPLRFYVLPLKPQIQRLLQEHWQLIEDYRMAMAQPPTDDTIRDITDGRVYQQFVKNDPRARGRRVFSVVASSDGAPLIKSKKFSIWPLICFLVELPPQVRYKFENILLAGLWYGKSKPNVPVFLRQFTNELSTLANGSNFNDVNGEDMPSVCRIQSVVPDLPAKSMLFNIKQYNGQFGCSTCKHPGTYNRQVRARLYEYTTSDTVAIRTAEETRKFAKIAERTGVTVFGIKGENVFGPLVDIPDNLPIDWMHCVCEGIMKRQLFKRWFDHSYAGESYSLLGINDELNSNFLSIKVPHDFTRKPRSVAELKHWKASEFRLFILFAGLPCLRHAVLSDEFEVDYFYHFALLSTALRFLHSVPVSRACVQKAQVLLDNFVRLLPSLYGIEECTYNSHALLHFPSQVLDHGSLAFTSAFVFEAFIAHLKNLYTGTRGLPRQMVEKLGVSQTYKVHVSQKCESTTSAAGFAKHLLGERPSVRHTDGGILLHEPVQYKKLRQFQNVLEDTLGCEPDTDHLISYRMTKDRVTFHSTMYPRKGNSCSYLVHFHADGRDCFGKVVCFILYNNVAHALVVEFRSNGVDVCQGLPPPQDPVLKQIVDRKLIGEHFLEVQETDRLLCVNCGDIIHRCLYVQADESGFITFLDTPYEHD